MLLTHLKKTPLTSLNSNCSAEYRQTGRRKDRQTDTCGYILTKVIATLTLMDSNDLTQN